MSEAKPQDGSTVKGYRTLTAGDIERMNRLKGVSSGIFAVCSILSERLQRLKLSSVVVRPKPIEQRLCAAWLSRAPKCRKPVCGHAALLLGQMLTVNPTKG
jgi:hypothetical protein